MTILQVVPRTKIVPQPGRAISKLLQWLIALSVSMLIFASPVIGAEVYKWKDDQGIVHYSDQPHDNKAEVITVTPPAVDQSTAERSEKLIQNQLHAEEKQDDQDHPSATDKAQSEQVQKACAQARDRIRMLTEVAPSRRLRRRNEDGTWHWLTTEEVAEELQKAKDTVAKFCQ